MGCIEIYAKLGATPATLADVLTAAEAFTDAARRGPAGVLRCDWFAHDGRAEVIGMLAYADAGALRSHLAAAAEAQARLTALARWELAFLGEPPEAARTPFEAFAPIVFRFDSGLDAQSGAARYRRDRGAAPTGHIEIHTRFSIHPGHLDAFRMHAAACLEAVRQRDPGTPRYDWLYDAAGAAGVAMDTYDDAASMFAHMRNCAEPHHHLLEHATMVTEFLGELPPEAAAAVAKYNPYVARFVTGLQAYSAGSLR